MQLLTCVSYLHYPVPGLQAGTLSWRVLVHGSDVLSRPRPLAVQVEAISVGPSPDHAETRPQLGTHLLDRNRRQGKQTGRRVTDVQSGGLKQAPFFTENTSTMGVCSERTSGTKIMESSSESLTMNMKPRPNMQVAAACWRVLRRFNSAESEAAAQLHVTPNCFPGRKRVWEACDWRSAGEKKSWRNWGGGGVVWRKALVPLGSETAACSGLRGGQWELGVDPLHASQLSQSHPVPLWDGRKTRSCFVIQEKTGAQTESLPSSVWMRRLLYLAAVV